MSRPKAWTGCLVRVLWLGLSGFVTLDGCASSPPVQYFALEPIAAGGPRIAPRLTIIQVAQVHLPPTLDQKQMVRHTGPYTLQISDQHRWSAPLDEMIRRVLSQDLIEMLPPHSVVLPNEPVPSATRKIVVNVLEFAPDAAGTIQFKGTWSLIGTGQPPQSRYVALSEAADAKDTADQVKGMSRILSRLAMQMAQAAAGP
ncbi:MAG TPA: PqiC family protein [Steroidobacteraceae bacterium]